MPDPTNAARQRRWYARQKAGTPWQPLTCQACGRNCKGVHGALCSRCWERLTIELQMRGCRFQFDVMFSCQ